MNYLGTRLLIILALFFSSFAAQAELNPASQLAQSYNSGTLEAETAELLLVSPSLEKEKALLEAKKQHIKDLVLTAIRYQGKLLKERDSDYRHLLQAISTEEKKSSSTN